MRLRQLTVAFLFVCAVFLGGCSGGAATVPPPTAAEQGKAVQHTTAQLIADLKKAPAKGAERLSVALEAYDSYARSYQGKFIDVATAAQELKALYEKKAPAAEIQAGQQKLQAAADSTLQ